MSGGNLDREVIEGVHPFLPCVHVVEGFHRGGRVGPKEHLVEVFEVGGDPNGWRHFFVLVIMCDREDGRASAHPSRTVVKKSLSRGRDAV